MDLDFHPQLQKQGGAARNMMMQLASLVDAGAASLPMALVAFEAKVDAQLQHVRWLHIMVP